jgi:hypothetical protein
MSDDEEATRKPLYDRVGVKIYLKAEVVESDGIFIEYLENFQSSALADTINVLAYPIGRFDSRMRHYIARF